MPSATSSVGATANTNKTASQSSAAAAEVALRFAEYEGSVQFRNTVPASASNAPTARGVRAINGSPNMELKRKSEQLRPSASLQKNTANAAVVAQNIYANTQPLLGDDVDDEADDADDAVDGVELRSDAPRPPDADATEADRPRRKFHSKSFSLSENQIMASLGGGGGLNLFHQNRELWEKRAERQSQQCLTTQRILSRHRIAPDLVMDLPFQADGVVDGVAPQPLTLPQAVLDDGTADAEGKAAMLLRDNSVDSIDQLTSAERFASGGQCTLKKNERFSGDGCDAAVLLMRAQAQAQIDADDAGDDVRLHIEETGDEQSTPPPQPPALAQLKPAEPMYADVRKSPIPQQNTKKFVTKFADLHLTGGCLTGAPAEAQANGAGGSVAAGSASAAAASSTATANTTMFTSFKPQVKAKPPLLKKPLVVMPPSTPEMGRRHEE